MEPAGGPVGTVEMPASPGWVRPSDVMRVRKLRAKRHALQARMSRNTPKMPVGAQLSVSSIELHAKRNPFRRSPCKRSYPDATVCSGSELSSDTTLFNLLHCPPHATTKAPKEACLQVTFSQALRQQGIPTSEDQQQPQTHWHDKLTLDWSLKTKLRFLSDKPLPWKHNFKTSEEASGITGMARCLWGGTHSSGDLDTSPNAEFYQRCLVWQHPSLPGVTLFPRGGSDASSKTSGSTGPYADTGLSTALHSSWGEALRSLHQLLRVRQCSYFYVCASSFTVLFRAAGVCGLPHAHALLTPSTRGLRTALKQEGIDFKMPFNTQSHSGDSSSSSLSGSSKCSLDSNSTTATCSTSYQTEAADPDTGGSEDECGDAGLLRDGEDVTSFLTDLGVDTAQFSSLSSSRAKASSRNIDRSPLSLVFVADPDTQGLVNFLLNSPSCVQPTGPLAGVPPTLLAPVAFQGATLIPFKVCGNSLRVRGVVQYSMEVSGPLLPHTSLQLTSLLTHHLSAFSVTATPLTHTLPFSRCTADISGDTMTKAFAEEGLVDCGLEDGVRSQVCQPLPPPGTDPLLPPTYRQAKYKDGKYTWTDEPPCNPR